MAQRKQKPTRELREGPAPKEPYAPEPVVYGLITRLQETATRVEDLESWRDARLEWERHMASSLDRAVCHIQGLAERLEAQEKRVPISGWFPSGGTGAGHSAGVALIKPRVPLAVVLEVLEQWGVDPTGAVVTEIRRRSSDE